MMLSDFVQPELPEWLRELYPFRTRTLQLGNERLSFVDEGSPDAPPLLLLHGNPTWSFLYRRLIARARERFRVIAPDQVGFGLSDKPTDPAYHTLQQHIGNLNRLIDALRLEHINLVMNGYGGPVGLGYAVTQPKNIKRLVLANAWPGLLPPAQRRYPLGMRLATAGRLGRWLDSRLNLSLRSLLSSRTHRPFSDLAEEGYAWPFEAPASRTAVPAFLRLFLAPDAETSAQLEDIYSRLRTIQAPAVILWGLHDPLLSKLPAYLLRDQLPLASEPKFLAEVGHYVPEEDPEALAAAALGPLEARGGRRAEPVFKIIL